jgi:hypothetical protein
MSKMGIGSFFGGFADGYQKGTKLNLEREKADRESQMFGLQKQQAELELEAKKREAAFQQDLQDSMAPLFQEIQAQMNPPPQNGLQGPQATQPLDLTAITERFADTSLLVGFRHGKVTLDQLQQARDLRKKLDDEGVTDAVQARLAGASDEEVAKIFNKRGKFKFDPKTMRTEVVEDKDGIGMPNVVVIQRNEDGTEKEVFNYANLARGSLSKEAYAQIDQSARTTKLKEKGDTFRTGMTTSATLQAAAMKEGGQQNPEVKALEKLMNTELEGILKSPVTALSSEEQRIIRADIFALARRYIDEGKATSQAAYNQAMRDVFTMYGKPLPQAPKAPK